MPRLRLYDVRMSDLSEAVGICQGDVPGIARYVNSAQRRLLMCREAGDEGWYGTWAEVAFSNVSRTNPYITCPRSIARLEKIQICQRSTPVQNQYYEYLNFGNGRLPRSYCARDCITEVVTRNNAVAFVDLADAPKKIRAYTTNSEDVAGARRVFVQGTDVSGAPIYTTDNLNNVMGEFITLDSPFIDSTYEYDTITGFQKDVTTGEVQIFQVDPDTGTQSLMLTMEPSEKVAGYRRYYLNALPYTCCLTGSTVAQAVRVTAIAKLEMVPVAVDTDYLLLQNLEAIIEECQSIRYSRIDNVSAKKMAQEKHTQAIRLLQGELVHYLGKEEPAINFAPFGTAKLACQRIGLQI